LSADEAAVAACTGEAVCELGGTTALIDRSNTRMGMGAGLANRRVAVMDLLLA
jgi:hypothetical protein